MRFFTLTTLCAAIVGVAYGETKQETKALETVSESGWKNRVELGQGYRHDSLKWSISGSHKKPNIMSELNFKTLHMYLSTLQWTLSNNNYVAKAGVGYAYAFSGKGTDSDYLGNNRKRIWAHYSSHLSRSYDVDSYVQFGKMFTITPKISLTPSLGYGYFVQKIALHDSKTTYSADRYIPTGKIHGHKSSYRATWSAPFLDLLAKFQVTQKMHLDVDYTFFFPVQYKGRGFWNLRTEEGQVFKQKARMWKSFGHKLQASLKYALTKNVEVGCTAAASYFQAQDGTDGWVKYKNHKYPFRKAQRVTIDGLLTLSYLF